MFRQFWISQCLWVFPTCENLITIRRRVETGERARRRRQYNSQRRFSRMLQPSISKREWLLYRLP